MQKQKRILILTNNPLHNAPRVIREIDSLKSDFDITAVGLTPPHDKNINYINTSKIAFSYIDRLVRKGYSSVFNKPILMQLPFIKTRLHNLLDDNLPDIVIAHNPTYLPYLFSFKDRKFKVVYNAHEYHPLEFEGDKVWMNSYGVFYQYLYENYLHKCSLVINVCDGIAEKCLNEFNVNSIVIPNAASYYDYAIIPKSKVPPMRFIHHGGTNADRKIEVMIDAFKKLGNDFELDLMLVKNQPSYYRFLVDETKDAKNIRMLDPVAFNQIIPFLTTYHAGVYVLPPVSFNNKYALPNKFFEFIQARLPLVSGPSIEMKRIIDKYTLGITSKDFTSDALVDSIKNVSFEQLQTFQHNADIAAKELSAESFQDRFIKAINTIV